MDSREQDNCAQTERKQKIQKLNDQFRRDRKGGYFCITDGIVALGHPIYREIVQAIAEFDDFTLDNDPHEEHDFGALNIAGHKIFWKIDYYDQNQTYSSPDPADPSVTTRFLTIMRASEY